MTTLTQPLELSLISAPIAAIDRRALSQAWYSALGLARATGRKNISRLPQRSAESATSMDGRRSRAVNIPRPSGCVYPERAQRSRRAQGDKHDRRRCDAQSGARDARTVQERRTPSPLAQRIGRGLANRTPLRTSITLEGVPGRVHVMLQKHGARLAVIAICPRVAQARVAHALGEARYALARHGFQLETWTKGNGSCT
ncbi:MAG TPA: hypothetical protein VIN40_00145 [Candidatus Tyrphobacter sp.]